MPTNHCRSLRSEQLFSNQRSFHIFEIEVTSAVYKVNGSHISFLTRASELGAYGIDRHLQDAGVEATRTFSRRVDEIGSLLTSVDWQGSSV